MLPLAVQTFILFISIATNVAQDEDSPLTLQPFLGDPLLDPVCPATDDIYPCFCYIVDNHLMNLDCSDIMDENELMVVFDSPFPDSTFNKLHLNRNNNLRVVRRRVFDSVSFNEIIFRDGSLEELEASSFKSSFLSATKLDFVNNSISFYPFEDLPNFSLLTDLHLTDNRLQGFPALESPSLQRLSLAHNPLGFLPRGAFDRLPSLVAVDLDHTHITVLLPGTFAVLPSLAFLFLASNEISSLKDGDLDFFSPNISIIDLGSNHIGAVTPKAISGLAPKAVIHLNNNDIKYLDEDTWKPLLEMKVHIWLSDNPLACLCDMHWIMLNQTFRGLLEVASCEDGTEFADLEQENFTKCADTGEYQ